MLVEGNVKGRKVNLLTRLQEERAMKKQIEKAVEFGEGRTRQGARTGGPRPDDMSPPAVSYRKWLAKQNERKQDLRADELRRPRITALRKKLAWLEAELEYEKLLARMARRRGGRG